jgi:sarcosine oxidase gamma subunit
VRVTIREMEPASYELLVERSYGRYLWDWLSDAALEFVA